MKRQLADATSLRLICSDKSINIPEKPPLDSDRFPSSQDDPVILNTKSSP